MSFDNLASCSSQSRFTCNRRLASTLVSTSIQTRQAGLVAGLIQLTDQPQIVVLDNLQSLIAGLLSELDQSIHCLHYMDDRKQATLLIQ